MMLNSPGPSVQRAGRMLLTSGRSGQLQTHTCGRQRKEREKGEEVGLGT
jgi:hypothetical protein